MKKIITLLLLFSAIATFSQSNAKADTSPIYDITGIDVKPEFPGGIEALTTLVNENYLKAGFASEVKGKVYAVFVIEKDGSLSNVAILRHIELPKARALIKILENLPKWNPGKQNGQEVRVRYALTLLIGK